MEPYADSREHLLDELERLDLLLRRYVDEWRRERGSSAEEFSGLYVADEEIDRLLSAPPGDGRRTTDAAGRAKVRPGSRRVRNPELTQRIEDCTEQIHGRKAATGETKRSLRLSVLTERFNLEPQHVDVLLVALAPELDRKYRTIYGYLRDDARMSRPTVDLVTDILWRTASDRLAARSRFSYTSPLVRNRLIRLAGEKHTPSGSREVVVEDRVVEFLLGTDDIAEELVEWATVISPDASLDDLVVDSETATTIAALKRKYAEGDRNEQEDTDATHWMAYLHGPEGVGKSTAIEALHADSGSSLVRVDADIFLAGDLRDTIRRLSREASLQDGVLYVADLLPLPESAEFDVEEILRLLDDVDGHVVLSGTDELSTHRPSGVEAHEFLSQELPVPPYERRRERWAAVEGLPADVDPSELAATFRLTDGQIDEAVTVAETLADGDGLDSTAVYRGCRSQSTEELGTLARKIDPHYNWGDIVLPDPEMRRLREIAAHVTNQGRVYADWGFGEKFSHGNGLVVLFNGPSGTGKTMAADIIAGTTGLDLYKIDLANVVSKYIGETEKNLGRIFDEAENSNAILLFDEADALFGTRTEVSDSHDRYANIEVNYLLQRIEEHRGTVLLTTNLEGNIDDAFRRRIHVRLDFPVPDRESREAIWRTVFPDETPVGSLDIEFLSAFEITGGNIKNIALTAAFLAAGEADRVEMRHVIAAAKQEFQKMGKLVPPDEFDEYQDTVIREGKSRERKR